MWTHDFWLGVGCTMGAIFVLGVGLYIAGLVALFKRKVELIKFARSMPNPLTMEWLLAHGFGWF